MRWAVERVGGLQTSGWERVSLNKAYQAMVGDVEMDRKVPVIPIIPATGVPISQEEIDG